MYKNCPAEIQAFLQTSRSVSPSSSLPRTYHDCRAAKSSAPAATQYTESPVHIPPASVPSCDRRREPAYHPGESVFCSYLSASSHDFSTPCCCAASVPLPWSARQGADPRSHKVPYSLLRNKQAANRFRFAAYSIRKYPPLPESLQYKS